MDGGVGAAESAERRAGDAGHGKAEGPFGGAAEAADAIIEYRTEGFVEVEVSERAVGENRAGGGNRGSDDHCGGGAARSAGGGRGDHVVERGIGRLQIGEHQRGVGRARDVEAVFAVLIGERRLTDDGRGERGALTGKQRRRRRRNADRGGALNRAREAHMVEARVRHVGQQVPRGELERARVERVADAGDGHGALRGPGDAVG